MSEPRRHTDRFLFHLWVFSLVSSNHSVMELFYAFGLIPWSYYFSLFQIFFLKSFFSSFQVVVLLLFSIFSRNISLALSVNILSIVVPLHPTLYFLWIYLCSCSLFLSISLSSYNYPYSKYRPVNFVGAQTSFLFL